MPPNYLSIYIFRPGNLLWILHEIRTKHWTNKVLLWGNQCMFGEKESWYFMFTNTLKEQIWQKRDVHKGHFTGNWRCRIYWPSWCLFSYEFWSIYTSIYLFNLYVCGLSVSVHHTCIWETARHHCKCHCVTLWLLLLLYLQSGIYGWWGRFYSHSPYVRKILLILTYRDINKSGSN